MMCVCKQETPRNNGFTVVELMVVLAIIVTITSIVFTNQNSFNKTLLLANTAYDIALSLRSAQTYGLSSRGRTNAAGSLVSSNAGYGLHFQTSSPGSFTLFADTIPIVGQPGWCHTPPANDLTGPDAKPGNCVYDGSEKVLDYVLGNNVTVNNFCAFYSGSWQCAYTNGQLLTSLDIVFARPNHEPFISKNGSYSASVPVTKACLSLTSPQGGERFISVALSGQIVANAASCP